MPRPLSDIPTVGTALEQLRMMRGDRLAGLDRFNREHGDIGRFGFVFGDVVLCNSPELVHDVLVRHARSFEKSPVLRTALYPLVGQGLFTSEGDLWKRQRKLMTPLFHPQPIGKFAGDMTAAAERAAATWQDGAVVDVARETTRITMAVAGTFSPGRPRTNDCLEFAGDPTGGLSPWPLRLARVAVTSVLPLLRALVAALSVALCASASVSACKRRPDRCGELEAKPPDVPLPHARDPHSRPSGALTEEDTAAFSRFRDDAGRASSLTVYEGLPSEFWECERYGRELAAKRTVEVRKFRFYERPLAVSPDAVARLLSVATSTSTFRAWRGGAKGCGDFHPDFALVWKAGAKTYELLLCFGCKEARLSGENIDLWFDMVSAVTFESTLEPFRQHRPLAVPSPRDVPFAPSTSSDR